MLICSQLILSILTEQGDYCQFNCAIGCTNQENNLKINGNAEQNIELGRTQITPPFKLIHMPRNIRIVTRDSRLALWQTNFVSTILEGSGHACSVLPIKSSGDIDLVSPIYEMGIEGVFTNELDAALLNNLADVAVHSMKDIPTVLAKGLIVAAVTKRGDYEDILFVKPSFDPEAAHHATIATSSLRRKAQWLKRFPQHTIVNVRGNIDTRIKKFWESAWDGMVLAKAGVVRLGYDLKNTKQLPWMLPAPAQGALGIVCREHDKETFNRMQLVNHTPTFQCAFIERAFLRHLQGGCSAPISAYATTEKDKIHFEGAIYATDGKMSQEVKNQYPLSEWKSAGIQAAEEIMKSDVARTILQGIQQAKHPKKDDS